MANWRGLIIPILFLIYIQDYSKGVGNVLRSVLTVSSHQRLVLPSRLLLQGVKPKCMFLITPSPTHVTCPTHLIFLIRNPIFGTHYEALL
jgi:hypothetical protein